MRKQRASKIEALWWFLASVLLLWWIAVEAEAVTTQPSECALTAVAALIVAQTPNADLEPYIKHKVDLHFVQYAKYFWHHARGDEARFLKWYRLACINNRVPRYYRVVNGEMVRGNGARQRQTESVNWKAARSRLISAIRNVSATTATNK